MKTRNGFVSNSSSSSFVIIGVKMTGKELEKEKWIYDDDGNRGENIPDGLDVYYINGKYYIIGELIAESDSYMEEDDFSLEELKSKFDSVSSKLNRPVKLLVGERQR